MKFKKVLSLILALFMVISLLPTMYAAEEDSSLPDGTISYDFTSGSFASRGVSGRQKLENKNAILAKFKTYPKDATTPATDPKDQWIYLGMNANYSGTASGAPWSRIDDPGSYIITVMGINLWPTSTVGEETVGEGYLALQVYVPKAGVYDLSIDVDAAMATASENVDIYLGKTSKWTNDYFADSSVKGTVSTITANTDTNPYTGAVCNANTNVIREGAKKFSELGIPESYLKASGISLKYDSAKTIELENQLVADEVGDYVFIIRNRDLNSCRIVISGLTLTPAEGSVRDDSRDTTFDFDGSSSHGYTGNKLETRAGVPEKSCVEYPKSPASAKDMWAYLGTNIAYTGTKNSNYFALINSDPNYILSAPCVYDSWMALKVYVPANGSYNISGTVHARTDTSAAQEMYLIPESDVLGTGKTAAETFVRPKDGGIYGTVALGDAGDRYVRTGAASFEELGIGSSYLISTSNTKNKTNGVEMSIESAEGIYLEEGSHILLFRNADTSATDSDKKRIVIKTLTFAPMVIINTDQAAVVDETEPKLSANVYGANGLLMQAASIEYSTEDTSVISINGNKITPISRGEATIVAKATVGTETYFGEYKISVTSPKIDELAIVSVSLDGKLPAPAYATRCVSVVPLDKYGAELELSETPSVRVWYENGEDTVEGIEEDGKWYITVPASVDSIKLCAEVTYKGVTKTGSADIEVINTDNEKHVVIDFKNQPITDVYDATLEEHGWKFVSWEMSSKGTVSLNLSGLTVTPRTVGKGVIDVRIPRSGYYALSISGNGNGIRSAEDVDIYLDGIYAGDYSFYNNGSSSSILPATFRTFYLEEGTHTLTFDCQPRTLQVFNPVTGEMEYVNDTRYGQPYSSIAFFARDGISPVTELVSEESYELNKGESFKLKASLLFENGVSHEIKTSIGGAKQDYSVVYELADGGEYISLTDDGTVTAKEVGCAHVKITASDNTGESRGKTWSKTVEIEVCDYSLLGGVEITADSFVMRPGERETVTFDKKAITLGGDEFADEVNWDSIAWTFDEEQTNVSFTENDGKLVATISGDASEGAYSIGLTVSLDGKIYNASTTLTVTHGKAGRTYYTDERVAIAQENIKKYEWAKKEKDSAVNAADRYVELGMEGLWNLLIGEGIPRSIRINRRGDTGTSYICRYCGEKVAASGYPWVISPLSKPWKISCPECKRAFPSNDFGSFYELGLGNDGVFDRALALSRHHNMIYHAEEFAADRDFVCDCSKPEMKDPIDTDALFSDYGTEITNWYKYYGYGQGYLKNDLYRDVYTEDNELYGIDPFRYNADLNEDGTPDRVAYNLVGGYDDVKSGMIWCVDDGWGYAPGNAHSASDTAADKWTFIAHYAHNGFWMAGTNIARNILESLRLAYIYTGEEKYGRLGAVMIDRMADLYPEYSSTDWVDNSGNKRNWSSLAYSFSDSSFNTGKISNDIWDAGIATELALCYDAFWPMYDDAQVQKFIAEKEAQYPGINEHPVTGEARLPKNSNKNIRDNIEKDLIYEIYEGVLAHDINGNFGSHQRTLAVAAVVYDREPVTREMLDWLFAESKTNSSTAGKTFNTGGELLHKIVNDVSRDGQGTESSSSYNYGWIEDTVDVATALGLYKGEMTEKENLWRNPKYITMLLCYNDMIDLHRGTQSIGDQGIMGSYRVMPSDTNVIAEAYKQIGIYIDELSENLSVADEADKAEIQEKIDGYKKARTEIAQLLYEIAIKGKNFAIEDLHYDIFTKDPESLYGDLEKEIKIHGEYDYDRSSMMTGYGFASLRGGVLYRDAIGSTIKDTTRDFWMYFGGALSHSHRDFLNLGIDAYGMSISSDNGYPEQTGSYPSRHQWTNVTLSHNTVVVNETSSVKPEDSAKPLHFDNKDTRVQLMDVDGSATYQTTDEYRRTLLMIDYDDDISYGVDFFKVLGGEDHLYSFHASSNTITETMGLDSIEHQVDENGNYVGTYAGPEAQFGNDPWTVPSSQYVPLKYPSGYTWLEKIRRDNSPEMNISVDYKIADMQKISRNPSNLMDVHLKVTTANDWTADEVTLAQSVPSRRDGWDKTINRIEYLLIRRKAQADEKLDTLYTTVFEPYNKTPYIKSIDRIDMVPANGESLGTDKAAAVRVELVDGRIDYVMYATRNDILYTITDNTVGTETEGYTFSFKGFAGVWTVKSVDGNLENVYSYLNDGSIIGDNATEHTDSITGKVTWHTKGLSIVNKAKVEFDEPIDEAMLNMLKEEKTSLSGRLFVGETTAPGNAAFVIEDAEISEDGKTAVLSFGNVTIVDSYDSYEEDTYNYSLTEGVTRFTIPMSYEDNMSPVFVNAPRNLAATAGSSISFNIVATSQLDDGVVTYKARTLPRGASVDESGAFIWKPSSSQVGENVVAVDAIDSFGRVSTIYFTITVQGSTTGGSSGGGGGGGTGTSTTPTTPSTPEKPEAETPDKPTKPDTSETTLRFVDLGNHAWAKDAINALAEDGIIKGTSETTFSPGNNITRADFAILLVRAFGLSSDNTENFADVSESDYFAKELAIARNCGIVNGIGDNKYAPRNTITRQDMMVIVYRAMRKLGVELESGEIGYGDFTSVSDYAKEAVSALITAGLINGKNGLIAPNDYTTRAEVAVLIKRILDYMK